MCRVLPMLRTAAAVTVFAILSASSLSAATPPATQLAMQPATQPAKPKVIVVPIQGPLYYQMATSEINKIVRGVTVQKPDAVIFMISSPGGSRSVSFAVAEQMADLQTTNVVAFVSGDYGGAFGPAVFPLFACNRVFVAPENTMDLKSMPAAQNGQTDPAEAVLSFKQVSLLQSWSAQHELPWSPIKDWLDTAGVLPPADPAAPAPAANASDAGKSVSTQLAARLGLAALRVTRAQDLEDVLAKLGLAGAWVITWPDPVAKSNELMQRMFQVADDLVKQTNGAIGAARQLDPRAARYELRDISRQYTIGTVSGASQPTDPRVVYQQTDTMTDHDQFADGGAAWRTRTDNCIAQVRKAIESNRNLAKLVARYPEIDIDPKELNESYETLSAWLTQLRAERDLRSPP